MQRYAETTTAPEDAGGASHRKRKAIAIPVFARGTFDTVHSQDPGHHRAPVSVDPEKYNPTWMAADIARVCIQADRHSVGNMVLFSYKTNEPKNSCYKGGAYLFSMKQYFFELVKQELYPKINIGFEKKDPEFFTDGRPDIMKALIHVLIEDVVDGPAHYKTCRLVPSMGTRVQTWPTMHSSRDFENPPKLTKTKQFLRTDTSLWKGKNTVSGLLAGAEFKDKKAPNLWSLAVQGKSKWYCSIETDLKKACDESNFHRTYLDPKFFVPGNGGDLTGILKIVDCEVRMTYGLAIESFDLTPMKDLSNFGKKKRRRNRRVQLECRKFIAEYGEACDVVFFCWPWSLIPAYTRQQLQTHVYLVFS